MKRSTKSNYLKPVPSMSEFVIESGVPIPKRTGGPGKKPKYPLRLLEVGQSMVLPRVAVHAVAKLAKFSNLKFVTRTVSKEKIRVWRVK